MARQAKTLNLRSARKADHDALIRRGRELHEARRYAAALPWFERALLIAPQCPGAIYNRANTLHMLERDQEAEPLLRALIRATPEELRAGCPESEPRGVQLDAHFLLFLVLLETRGFCEEAFALAAKHLRLRRRGVHSVWTAREVRSDIAEKSLEWRKHRKSRG